MKNLLLNNKTIILNCFFLALFARAAKAETGYRLWLRYDKIEDTALLKQYRTNCQFLISGGNSKTISVAENELRQGIEKLLATTLKLEEKTVKTGSILLGTPKDSQFIKSLDLPELDGLGAEGFAILTREIEGKKTIIITANSNIGVLYGTFHFLKLLQTHQNITNLKLKSVPKIENRILNHWDNLDGSVERGYAGTSIWDWDKLPEIDKRYIDYARANASIGINGTVLNNVNADPEILTEKYLKKVQALADAFRPYGIQVYITAVFSAPIGLGGLETADPLDPEVKKWWKRKTDEIYQLIPDFGGFLVKANSEGQPGPQDYGRTHADGANMMAKSLEPYGGLVMWRAFVYNNKANEDRAREAYDEFKPFDGKFNGNVLLQVKNGPIDFQPREPFNPLFGAMPKTPLMLEFQITQEYLGFATYLVYLGTLYKEILQVDTYAKGKGSSISRIIEGKLSLQKVTGIAGVANIGNDTNWTGHPFAQANWYAFGRLAWDPELSAKNIAGDWLKMTFTNEDEFLDPVKKMMLQSREVAVDYMTPLGLTMLMDVSHYRPAPWRRDGPEPVGTLESFHRADAKGIGFDRTRAGSDAVSQYFSPVQQKFEDLETCPEELLLWFHHIDWNYKMKSGNRLWDELCYRYYSGVQAVEKIRETWQKTEGIIDQERFEKVSNLLEDQEQEARIWRNACVLYFQTFSGMPIPKSLKKPEKSLEYYVNMISKN